MIAVNASARQGLSVRRSGRFRANSRRSSIVSSVRCGNQGREHRLLLGSTGALPPIRVPVSRGMEQAILWAVFASGEKCARSPVADTGPALVDCPLSPVSCGTAGFRCPADNRDPRPPSPFGCADGSLARPSGVLCSTHDPHQAFRNQLARRGGNRCRRRSG